MFSASSGIPAFPSLQSSNDEQLGQLTRSVLVEHLIAAVVFSALGIIVLAICFWLMEKLTPFSMVKEIEEDENVALGIVVGAAVIGISLIIAAAIHG